MLKHYVTLQTETTRVIWSFHATTDPTSEVLTSADRHSHKGALSLNLLGGLPDAAPDPQDLEYFDIKVDNVSELHYQSFIIGFVFRTSRLCMSQANAQYTGLTIGCMH